jgi:hypothetical protein
MAFLISLRYFFLRRESGLQDDYKAAMNIVTQSLARHSHFIQAATVIIENKGKQMGTVCGSLNKHSVILLARS